MKFALALKGGGQRGLIPAIVLARLEKQTGKLCRDIFSYVSGTSTGALLAGAICAGIPASQMVDFYTNSTKEVFLPSGVLGDVDMVARGHKYDISNLMKLLEKIFSGPATTWTINDSPIGLLIVSTAANGHDWYFVKDGKYNAKTTGKVSLLEAMCASAAAPTYFDPQRVTIPSIGKSLWMFDGGTGSGANPTYQCANEMLEFDVFDTNSTKIFTIGTGYYPVDPTSDIPAPKGLLATIEFATSTLVGTSEDLVDQAAMTEWPWVVSKYDWPLPSNIAMDDLSAIPALTQVGNNAAAGMNWKEILGL